MIVKAKTLTPVQYSFKDTPLPIGEIIDVDIQKGMYTNKDGNKVELVLNDDFALVNPDNSSYSDAVEQISNSFTLKNIAFFMGGGLLAFGLAYYFMVVKKKKVKV